MKVVHLCLLLLCAGGDARAAGPDPPLEVEGCAGVLVLVEDPGDAAIGETVAGHLCRARDDLRARLPRFALRGGVRARVARDMEAYTARTGRAWYIAAALCGDEIVTQPGRGLGRLEDLGAVLTHELAHLALRRQVLGLPLWLEEGLVQHLAGVRAGDAPPPADEAALDALERRLAAADAPREASRRDRAADYRAALALVERLVSQVGLTALADALPALAGREILSRPLAGRALRDRLFGAD